MYNLFTNDSFSFSDFNSLANIYGTEEMKKFYKARNSSLLYKLFIAKDEKQGITVELCVYVSKKRNVYGYYRYFMYLHFYGSNINSYYSYVNGFDYEGSVSVSLFKKLGFNFKDSAIYPPEMCFKDMCELMGLKEIYSRIENV